MFEIGERERNLYGQFAVDTKANVIQNYQPPHKQCCKGFVGESVFKNAIKHCQERSNGLIGDELKKFQDKIHHFEKHLLDNQKRTDHRLASKLPLIDGLSLFPKSSNSSKNKVYTSSHCEIDAEGLFTLKRQDDGLFKKEVNKDQEVNKAFDITNQVIQFYSTQQNLDVNRLLANYRGNSSEDASEPIISFVHYGKNYDNAFFDNEKMHYGDGYYFEPLVDGENVGPHEISHGVTEWTAGSKISRDGKPTGLDYQGDSGGLNEMQSDLMAKLMELNQKNLLKPDETEGTIGKGVIKGYPNYSLRDMYTPGAAYKDVEGLGSDPQEGYDQYPNWSANAAKEDPHLTSAVGNKAWYHSTVAFGQAIEHEEYPCWKITGTIALETLSRVGPNCLYPTYAQETMKMARQLINDAGLPEAILNIIGQNWREVKVL